MTQLFGVVTTIRPPTPALTLLATFLSGHAAPLIVMGDEKGPPEFELNGAEFFDLATQIGSGFVLARVLPVGHYARKNLGYLEAIARGAECIYETDDDNAPLGSWDARAEQVEVRDVDAEGWVNVYRFFSREQIWPRGLPLDALGAPCAAATTLSASGRRVQAPVQQGLANGSPDVDAIWRLVLNRAIDFVDGPSVLLPPGAWCPFNSQSTWWWPDAFPLLYLPSHCSFRMTDIWRSFVAQRCLWALGLGVVFHGPEVVQERNEHDPMRDFAEEVPGFLQNRRIAELLDSLSLAASVESVGDNLMSCYQALVAADVLPVKELNLVSAWLQDLNTL